MRVAVPDPPSRSVIRQLGWFLTVVAALIFAWFVLVTLRLPAATADLNPLGLDVEASLTQTVWLERVSSVLTWIISVSTTLVLGGLIFRAFVADDGSGTTRRRRPVERTLRLAALSGIAAGIASVPLRAAAVAGGGLTTAVDLDALHFVLTSRFGDAAVLRCVGLAVVLLALAARPKTLSRPISFDRWGVHLSGEISLERRTKERAACLAGALVILASYSLVGHPQATASVLVACQVLHITAAATWFGGVAFLAVELHHQRRHPARHVTPAVVHRFSHVAGGSVAVAVTTGVILAFSQLGTPGALLTTGYGRALVMKLTVLAVVLALGGYNHRRVVPAILRHGAAAWPRLGHHLRQLRQTTMVEAVLIAVGILLATAVMVSGGF